MIARLLPCALALLVCSTALADEPPGGKRLAPFALEEVDGGTFDASGIIGRDVIVVAFWATWCKPCKLELAALHKLYKKHKGKGLTVLAISVDGPDSIAEVRGYKHKFGYTFPVLLDTETALLERYNPRGDVPFSFIVDRSGNIVETRQGFNPGDEIPLEKHLLTLLKAKPSAGKGPAASTGGKRLAPFQLPRATGEGDYDVTPHIGRDVVVTAFWATWCKPCTLEIAALHKLYKKHKDKGLVVLAVSTDGPDSIAEVNGYVRKFGYTFPVLLDSETAVLERYNPRGDVPFSMITNRAGQIVKTHAGFNPGDEIPLEKHLLALLAEKAGPPTALTRGDGPSLGYWETPEDPPHIEGTETLQFRYLASNGGVEADDDVFLLVNRLTIGAATGPLSIGVRADNTQYLGYDKKERCPNGEADCIWEDDHRIERLWVQYKSRKLQLRLGDFYHSLGRGLTFSARKLDEVGIDTAIRGGRGSGRIGPVKIQAFGGVANPKNVDIDVAGFREDTHDQLAGGEIAVDLPYNMTLAARGLFVEYDEKSTAALDNADWTVGGSFEVRNIAKMLSIYFEGNYIENLQTSNISDKNRDAVGWGLYASVQLTPVEGLSLLLEFKDYRRFDLTNPDITTELRYHEPPTIERYDQIIPSNANATGGRLLAEYYIKPIGMLVFANVMYYGWTDAGKITFDDDPDNFSDDSNGALHTYGGIEKRFDNGIYINLSGGYRVEPRQKPKANQLDYKRKLWHIEGDFQFPLVGKHSMGLRAQHRSETKDLGGEKDFERGNLALTYGFSPWLSVSFLWTYQTENDTEPELLNLAAEVVYHFSDWGQVSVYGGRNSGDFICASGVCRFFPLFEGVRTTFIARF